MKKIIAVVVTLALICGCLLALTACESADFTVGICQLVTHDALDQATQGFMDSLKDELQKAGKTVKFDLQNAQGDPNTCITIANNFVAKNVDLIMANATASLQAAQNATTTIPILGTSITDYKTALDIKGDFDGVVGGNISGTSDLAPLDEQAKMIKDLYPTAQNVGLLYCSAEPNSKYQVDVVQSELAKLGITATLLSFADSNDILPVVTNAVEEYDALYVPTDNTAASCANIIDSVCRPKKIPVFCGESGTCKGCGIVTLSISYYNLGVETGKMAAKILLGEQDISTMKIAYDTVPAPKYNKEICDEICNSLGITIPADYVAID